MSAAASPAADFSLAILGEFVALGVTDAVLSPGSRSQALALALAELHRAKMLDLQVRIDERVAGFTALGLAVETGSPALVVTTSGTAVANLMPAVLEAHHSGVPMLLLTSDRPAAMRGTAGNQTTWQSGLFGRFVRRSFDVEAPTGERSEPALAVSLARLALDAALGTHTGRPGPVHLNLQLREPLSGVVPDLAAMLAAGEWMPGGSARAGDQGQPAEHPLVVARGPRTVVIAGHGSGPRAEDLAHEGGWPLIAEPSSGARYGRNLVVAYRELLNDPELGARVERAIVFGHPTLSREVPLLSLRDDVETIVVTAAARLLDRADAGQASVVGSAVDATLPVDDADRLTDAIPVAATPESAVPLDVYNPGHRVRTFAIDVRVEPRGSGGATDAGDAADTADAAETADAADAADAADRQWLRDWVLASRAVLAQQSADEPVPAPNIELANSSDIAERRAYRLAETAALKAPITRRTLALAVWQATWPHDRLVLGASRLIRDLDRAVPGKKIRVHANRGLAGIDGTISTSIGIALASQRDASELWAARASTSSAEERAGVPTENRAQARAAARSQHGVTRVLLGDLTLLHDVGALLFGTGEARPRIQVIVANDGGGTIFDTLEVAATADREAFDRVMLTPQSVDVEALAKAYGWAYSRASTRPELDRELTAPITGPSILEVPLAR